MTIFPEPHRTAPHVAPEGQVATPFVGSDLSDQAYQQVCEILFAQQQFELNGYKDVCVKRRIAARIRQLGYVDPQIYIERLQGEVEEQQQLLEALTIHVSHFFRNPSTYRVLEMKILPELLQAARSNLGKVRIWSAGCAGGEEPYSLALLCQELAADADLVTILATDLSHQVLQQAKRASYPQSRLEQVPAEMLQRCFEAEGNNYRLRREVRQRVRFYRHDILAQQPYFRVDLIVCRNLLIYFSRQQQERILRSLAEALPPGGYLVLGRAETLVASCRELFTCIDPAERIYQRLQSDAPQVTEKH